MIDSNYLITALQVLLQPFQGTISSGLVTARTVGDNNPTATLWPGTFGIPSVDGCADESSTIVVRPNPATEDGSWVITTSGTSVAVESVQGGEHVNIPAGAEIQWTDEIEHLDPFAQVISDFTGGTISTKFGALKQVKAYKDLGQRPDAQAFFGAQVGQFPAAVLCWSATSPADSSSLYGVGPDNTRTGRATRLYVHQFDLMLITSRLSGMDTRRREGDVIRDNVIRILQDRWNYRGLKLSSGPKGIQVADARLAQISDAAYVDVIRFGCMFAITRTEERRFAPWITAAMDLSRDTSRGNLLTVDDEETIPQTTPPVPTGNFRKLARGY